MEITKCSKGKDELIDEYNSMNDQDRKMLDASYSTVSDTKASEDRLEEIKEFCKKMGFKKIGIAFCKGLRTYGEMLDRELSKDFEVYSVCCNAESINKSDIKVKQIKEEGEELACNPLGQSATINDKEVDLVIKCGFCLGHDILFSKNITAPTTTFIVKDRKHKHKTAEIIE